MRLIPPTAATAIPRADACIATTPVQINSAPNTMRATRSLAPMFRLNIIFSLAKAREPCTAICKESEFRRMDSRSRLCICRGQRRRIRAGLDEGETGCCTCLGSAFAHADGPANRAECQSRGQGGVDAVPSSERLGRLAHPPETRPHRFL